MTYQVGVFVYDDAGFPVDFTARDVDGARDYYSGLLQAPTITIKADDGGRIYVASVSDLVFNNRLFGDFTCGFWDQALPVTIHRSEGTHTFSSWKNRRVLITAEKWDPYGEHARIALATMRIKEVVRTQETATISLVSRHEALIKRSASTVKNGGEWYRNLTIPALLRLLVQASDPTLSIAIDDQIDLGTLDTLRASSWGGCPGMVNGAPSTYHWLPRELARDQQDPDVLWVGLEAPGSNARSGGALCSFNVVTGEWTIWQTPASLNLDEGWPIAIWAPATGSTIYVMVARERAPSGASKAGFYETILMQMTRGTGSWQAVGSWDSYWPARYALLKGSHDPQSNGTDAFYFGYTETLDSSPPDYQGEALVWPMSQVVDSLADYVNASVTADPDASAIAITGLTQKNNVTPIDEPPYSEYQPIQAGIGGAIVAHTALSTITASTRGALRLWMNDTWSKPAFYTQSGVDYVIYLRTTPGAETWSIVRKRLSNGSTDTWTVSLGGSVDLYDRHVTAWSLYPSLSGSSRKLLVAATQFVTTSQNTNPPLATTIVYEITFDGASGSAATVTARITNNPTDAADPADAVSVVALWCPYKLNQEGVQTADYAVGVVLNRGNVSGPCYGIMIYKASNTTDIIRYRKAGYERGPTSGRAFAGFVRDSADNNVFRFVDQANGQVWRCEVDLAAESAEFTIENGGFPLHAETSIGTVNGVALTPTAPNDQVRYLWGCAPGPHGDVTNPYWERQASSGLRRVPGLYPLVQLSTKVTPTIEVADFGSEDDTYTCMDAVRDLMQILIGYRMYPDADGNLVVTSRAAPTGSFPRLVLPTTQPVTAVEDDEYPLTSYSSVRTLYSEIENSVEVTPFALQSSGDAEAIELPTPGSTFRGKLLYKATTERASRVGLSCAMGGDVVPGGDASQQAGLLWRWYRVLETIHTYLTVGCGASDTSVQLANITERGEGQFFSGEQRIRVGDYVRVRGADSIPIASFGAASASSVIVNLTAPVGVSAEAYAEVEIIPKDNAAVSDGTTGITTFLALMGTSSTRPPVRDASQIRVGMVLQVEDPVNGWIERMLVTAKVGDTLTVERAVFGSKIAGGSLHPTTIVKAYVATRVAGKLYEVGDTGILFGVDIDPSADAKDRTVAAGDAFVVTTKGFSLRPMEHARIRRSDADSIAVHGKIEKPIKNRFLDPTRAEAVARNRLAFQAWPRTGVTGGSMPYFEAISPGGTVITSEARFVPPSLGDVPFEVRSLGYRLGDQPWSLLLDLASFEDLPGAAARPSEEATGGEGFGIVAGRSRRR